MFSPLKHLSSILTFKILKTASNRTHRTITRINSILHPAYPSRIVILWTICLPTTPELRRHRFRLKKNRKYKFLASIIFLNSNCLFFASSLFATDFELPHGKLPMFIHDTSTFWYKPKISREDAVRLLMDKPTGTFITRDSNSFRNAYGMALKISPDKNETTLSETVRHFLIESTSKGVQIKGCIEEPVFSSLAALVNQHSVTRISLPTKLKIPVEDVEEDDVNSSLARLYEN